MRHLRYILTIALLCGIANFQLSTFNFQLNTATAQVGADFFITPDSSGHEPMPTTLEGWAKRLNTFGHFVPQEKVYVHTDNTCYFLGDTLWYAVYTRRTDRDVPSRISRVLYAELFNQDGYLVERQILEMKDGRGNGCFALPDTLYAGYYELRAYTRWQLNWGQYEHEHTGSEEQLFFTRAMAKEFFRDYDKLYSRVFPVFDKPKAPGQYTSDMTLRPLRRYFKDEAPRPQFHLSLYPEGGTLVADAPCRMAFEVSNAEGEVGTGRCVIRDAGKHVVADARTANRGRGLLHFTPLAGEKYEAVFYADSTDKHNKPIAVEAKIDKIPTEGISLMLNLRAEALDMEVNARGALAQQEFGYTIMHEGVVEEFGRLQGRRSAVTIPRTALRPGVNQMTLFDADGRIYADRLFFVSSPDIARPTLAISGMKAQYAPYERIELDIASPTSDSPSISLAVRDASVSAPLYDNASILVEMLLSSEIKGFVPNPGWYFEHDDEEHRLALDLLMLTQGWRRFDWREMATPGDFQLTHPNEYSQIVEGDVHRYDEYQGENFDEKIQIAQKFNEMGLSDNLIRERLNMEYGENTDLSFMNKDDWRIRWAGAYEMNRHRIGDDFTKQNGRSAYLPFTRDEQGNPVFDNRRRNFASQRVYQAGVATPQTRTRDERPSWQRIIGNSSKWSREPYIYAEFTKPGCQPLVGETTTQNGMFKIALPDIDGYCMMILSASDSTKWKKASTGWKKKRNRRYRWGRSSHGIPLLTKLQEDNRYGHPNAYPEYYVRLSFPYPRFVKPYSWYQCHLAPRPLSKGGRAGETFADAVRLPEIVVRSRRSGRRPFDAGHPVLSFDAYDAFNATVDAGLNLGRFNVGFTYDVAHTYVGGMNLQRHYNVEERYDSLSSTRNRSPYMLRQYYQLSHLDKVIIYTDYAPRQEGNLRYEQADQPDVTVNLIKFPEGTTRYHYLNRRILLQGFNYPTAFYHADYSHRRPSPDDAPDYRRTLYWNPELPLDKDGRAHVVLYNNGGTTQIEASAAGQTSDGKLLYCQ